MLWTRASTADRLIVGGYDGAVLDVKYSRRNTAVFFSGLFGFNVL